MFALGALLDALRVSPKRWFVGWLLSSAVVCALLLQGQTSLEATFARSGSIEALVVMASQLKIYVALLMSLVCTAMRRYRALVREDLGPSEDVADRQLESR